MAMSFICLASLGRCSLITMPGTAVSMALNSPPLGMAGLGIEGVDLARAAGHPEQDARLSAPAGCVAASAARASIQPEVEKPTTPAAASRSICRRDSSRVGVVRRFMVFPRVNEIGIAGLVDAGDGRRSG